MTIKISGVGKVKSIENFSRGSFTGTEVKIYAKTGEKKKNGEQYPPSHNFKLTLTEAQGASLPKQKIDVDSQVFFSGNLNAPYTKALDDGGILIIQQLGYGSVEKIYTEADNDNQTSASATTETYQKRVEDFEPALSVFEDIPF